MIKNWIYCRLCSRKLGYITKTNVFFGNTKMVICKMREIDNLIDCSIKCTKCKREDFLLVRKFKL